MKSVQSQLRRMFCLLVLAGAAIVGSANAATAQTDEPSTEHSRVEIEVGQPFPDLRLPTLDGTVRSISDFRGNKFILHVFASW